MPITKTINVKLHSINVFLPSTVSIFEPKPKFVKFLEHHSYVRGFCLMWTSNGQYYQTERLYSDDLYQNLVSFMNKHDEPINLEVEETRHQNVYNLIDVHFPENFKLAQYTKVVDFIPLALRTKHCSTETYEDVSSGKNLDNTPIYTVYDPKYQGDTTHSLTAIVENEQYITKFSDLTHSEALKIKSAIHSFSTLKGTFRFTQRTATLINIA